MSAPSAASVPSTAAQAGPGTVPQGYALVRGSDALRRAQWALFAATAVEGPALNILFADAATAEGAAQIAVEAERLSRPFARLEGHLAGRDWLLDRFTVADVMAADCLRYAQGHAPLMQAHPAIADWLARCQARPAFQAMWAARLAEPA